MAKTSGNGPQSCVNGGAKNLTGLSRLFSPKSADIVGNSIGSAHDQKSNRKLLRMGLWNIRTMQRKGKLENIKREMNRNRLNILGLSEVQWKESKDITSDGIRIISMVASHGQAGVAILLDRETAN